MFVTARRLLVSAAALAAAVSSVALAASPVAADSAPGRCERLIAYREGGPIGTLSKIMGVPESGGTPQIIYDGPLSELDPDWSPDGKQLVFATRINNAGVVSQRGLDVVDVTTGRVRTLLRSDSPPDFTRYPAWSPQGDAIAYVSSREGVGPLTAVRLIRPDGTGDRLLVKLPELPPEQLPQLAIQDLSWEPDGRRLWVTASKPDFSDWRLWSVDVATATLRLEDDRFRLGFPRFAERLAPLTVIEGDEAGVASLYLTDRRTLEPRVRIFPVADHQWSPALSPHEDAVAYLRTGSHPTKANALEVIAKNGKVREVIAPALGFGSFHREGLDWQPKGRCVAGFDY